MTFLPPTEGQNKWTEFLKSIDYESLANALEEQQEEEAYLKELADEFAPKQAKNYSLARSIVLDIHSGLDYIIAITVGMICIFGRRGRALNKDKVDLSELVEVLYDIPYGSRLKVLDKTKAFTVSAIKILREVNQLRNAFAHRYHKDSKHFKYGGELIFKKETVNKLIADYETVMKEHNDFLKPDELPPADAGIAQKKPDNE